MIMSSVSCQGRGDNLQDTVLNIGLLSESSRPVSFKTGMMMQVDTRVSDCELYLRPQLYAKAKISVLICFSHIFFFDVVESWYNMLVC